MYTRDTRVTVYPLTRQEEGEEVIVGRPETGVFLALPEDAVWLLDLLSAGKTVGEAQDLFRTRFGETPDMDDFLHLLESKGLVQPPNSVATGLGGEARGSGDDGTTGQPTTLRHHFSGIPEPVARSLFGPRALSAYGTLIATALTAIAIDPSLLAGRSALLFHHQRSLKLLAVLSLAYIAIFIHELAHLVAARAVGVDSRLGIGHRLWVLVAETDMTGLWAVKRSQRYLPFLAGPLLDAVSASIIVLLNAANRQGWISLPPLLRQVLLALLFVYEMALLFQLLFFVRTDVYYVVATWFRCKNLLGDTEAYLRNRLARFFRFIPAADLSHLPEREKRAVRGYAVLWVGGRLVALTFLVTVTLPVTLHYVREIITTFRRGYSRDSSAFFDAVALCVVFLLPPLLGFTLWIRSLIRRWKLIPWKQPATSSES